MTEQFDKGNKYSALSPETIIDIQKVAITFGDPDGFGLSGAVRDFGTLEYICDKCNAENDPITSAASALFYIANYHPFFDDNKRIALLTAYTIMEGHYIVEIWPPYPMDAEIRHIAGTEGTLEESIFWFRRNARPIQ